MGAQQRSHQGSRAPVVAALGSIYSALAVRFIDAQHPNGGGKRGKARQIWDEQSNIPISGVDLNICPINQPNPYDFPDD